MAKDKTENNEVALADEVVMNRIYMIRGQRVMLDRDLAILYGVETRVLKQSVRRNIDRFPEDFVFEMTREELQNWRSHFVTSNSDRLGLRHAPFCFTEQGVAMLSSVLNSKQAIHTNIRIMRVFTRIRQMLTDNTELQLAIAEMKHAVEKISKKQDGQDKNIELIFGYIDRLQEKADQPTPEREKVGYKIGREKKEG